MRRVLVMVIVALAVGCGQAANDKQQPQPCPDIMCEWESEHDVDASEVGCREPAESDELDYEEDYCGQFNEGDGSIECQRKVHCKQGCDKPLQSPDFKEDFCNNDFH